MLQSEENNNLVTALSMDRQSSIRLLAKLDADKYIRPEKEMKDSSVLLSMPSDAVSKEIL